MLTNTYYFPLFLIKAILVRRKWYLTEVWICTSLVTNDAEHLFMCLFVICLPSLEIIIRSLMFQLVLYPFVLSCSSQHFYSQPPRTGSNPNIHQQVNELINHGTPTCTKFQKRAKGKKLDTESTIHASILKLLKKQIS